MKWTFAKSYAKTAPHEWVNGRKEPAFFKRMERKIKKYGVWEPFQMPGGKPYRVKYWYNGRYRYWVDWFILNRTRVGWRYPKRLTGLSDGPIFRRSCSR